MKHPLVAISCFLSLLFILPVQAEDEADHVIKYRQYLMASISSHYKSLKLLTSGKITQPNQWSSHARALHDMAGIVEGAFPEDSDFGETDAKEAIWENKDDFNHKARDLVTVTQELLPLVQNKDQAGAKEQVAKIGQSCKSCHKKYREK